MSNVFNISEQSGNSVIEEAQAWVVRLDDDRPSKEDLAGFNEWIDRSPIHAREFRRMAGLWIEMDHLADHYFLESALDACKAAPVSRPVFPRPVFAALAVVCTLLVTAAAYFQLNEIDSAGPFIANYRTATGEIRSVALPDGSQVQLNTASRADVSYGSEARTVYLHEGEAHFRIAHAPSTPFIVYSGKYAIKATGTAFTVYVNNASIELTVTDGRVEVSSLRKGVSPGGNAGAAEMDNVVAHVPFTKGQHVVMNREIESVVKMTPEEIKRKLSWRDGLLVFDAQRLDEVISEVNRYVRMKIVISDPEIADIRFGGYFKASDIEAILPVLEDRFGIRVERVNEDLIYLSRDGAPSRHPGGG